MTLELLTHKIKSFFAEWCPEVVLTTILWFYEDKLTFQREDSGLKDLERISDIFLR